jgi:adenine-specific DNA-methyltransferase
MDLIRQLVFHATSGDDTVLDFFAGSGTTGHAVMAQNAEDGGTRRFVLVQLPEPTGEGSSASNAGFKNVADISRKRIDTAGKRITEKITGQSVDVGFRVFTLSDTSFSKWREASDTDATALEQRLLDLRDSAANDATPDALLTEILLKQGYSLNEHIGDVEIADLRLKTVGEGLVLAYLDESIKPTLDQLRAVVAEKPARFVILEDAFQGDDELKTNLAQECKSRGVELWTA